MEPSAERMLRGVGRQVGQSENVSHVGKEGANSRQTTCRRQDCLLWLLQLKIRLQGSNLATMQSAVAVIFLSDR